MMGVRHKSQCWTKFKLQPDDGAIYSVQPLRDVTIETKSQPSQSTTIRQQNPSLKPRSLVIFYHFLYFFCAEVTAMSAVLTYIEWDEVVSHRKGRELVFGLPFWSLESGITAVAILFLEPDVTNRVELWRGCIAKAVFRQSTKPPICPSFWRLGKFGVCFSPLIFRLGGNTYSRLACYLKTRRKCAGLCVSWAEVWMTSTVVWLIAGEF